MKVGDILVEFLDTEGDGFVLEEVKEHNGGMWDTCIDSVVIKHVPTGKRYKLYIEFDGHCYDAGIGVDYASKEVTHELL